MTNQKEQQGIWDAIAPSWHSFRQKAQPEVAMMLKGYAETWKPGKILDVGCGNCRNLLSFSYNGFECYGVDFSKKMLEFAQQHCKKHDLKVNLKQADATELPFPKEHFDYVLSISMLHHLNEEERVMAVKEIRRVLKYEGKALITVWNKLQLRFLFERKDALIPWHIADKVYQRYYHLFMHGELKSLLKNEGFKIIKSNIFGKNLIFLVEK